MSLTLLATDEGWLYLASVEDLYSRQIVGWAMGDRMTQDLVIQALDQAVARYQPPEGLVHHSDRGSQYAATDYQARLAQYHMVGSMSRNSISHSRHQVVHARRNPSWSRANAYAPASQGGGLY